jgi:serine/threonine-protein kinase
VTDLFEVDAARTRADGLSTNPLVQRSIMSEETQQARRTLATAGTARGGQRCAEFEAAWQAALQGGPPPRIEAFLQDVPDAERAALRVELEKIQLAYQTRDTITAEHPATPPAAPAVTTEYVSAPPGPAATTDFVPTPTGGPMGDPAATTDHVPGEAGAKGELPSGQPPRPRRKKRPEVPGFEILGELGHGGMGVVYQARQTRLKRPVALKMILAGSHASPQQLARFNVEALAVARLQHPNIVQIYEVGDHDGLPFFALEYVGGGTLHQKIERKPQPPRQAAELVSTLAQAMQYAHEHGVVHRDLKPANVLLTEEGVPKITDFGLAKAVEEDSALTGSGTILGTPSYMAPEQARGQSHDVGPLADVYALGALLYDLLTGRPPFHGATPLDTLEQVRSSEPVPPTQLVPKLPRDLETICLKCLEKEPRQRYASACDLAADLHRFQSGEPILARPVSAPERFVRWCRRNPKIAALGTAVFGLLLAVATVSTAAYVQIKQAQAQTEAALQQARDNAEAEKAARLEAVENAKVAQEQSSLTLSTIYGLISVTTADMRARPDQQEFGQKLLAIAEAGLERLIRSTAESKFDRTIAGVFQRRGDIFQDLGQTKKAFEQYQRAHAIVERLARESPEDPIAKRNLAVACTKLGNISLRLGDLKIAQEYHRQALDLRLEWAKLEPTNPNALPQREVSRSYGALGALSVSAGNPVEALEYYRRSHQWHEAIPGALLQQTEVKRERASTLDRLGEASFKLGLGAEAQQYYQQALDLRKPPAVADRAPLVARQDLSVSLIRLGDVCLLLLKDAAAARKHYEECLELRKQIVALNPRSAHDVGQLADAYYRLATTCLREGQASEAANYYRECLALRKKLAAEDSNDLTRQVVLLLALARCGQVQEAATGAEQLRQQAAQNQQLLYFVACVYALCSAAAQNPDEGQVYQGAALRTLRQALALGWKDLIGLETNPDLDAIRQHPDYAALVAELQRAREQDRQKSQAP